VNQCSPVFLPVCISVPLRRFTQMGRQKRTKDSHNRIFIAAEIFPPDIGGPATYALNLANELNQRGFKVRILCYGKPETNELSKNIQINWVSKKWPLVFKYFLYFLKLLFFSQGFDVIYAQGPVASGLPALWVKKLTGKKIMVKVVGDYAWEQAIQNNITNKLVDEFQKEKSSGKYSKLQKIERKVCQAADKVITPSNYLKQIVQNWGVREDKIKVVYNAMPLKHKNIKALKQNRDNNLIISVGRLVTWKGFELLIKIMPELLKINPNFKLKIYGHGPEKEKLNKLISELQLEEKVFIDKIGHNKLMSELIKAEMFVLNSGYEGLSHTILEAMVAEIPVITTNIGGNPELIKDGYNGLLVEYNNKEQLKSAILELHNNPELQEKFIKNSKEVLKKFDLENMINQTVEVCGKQLTNNK